MKSISIVVPLYNEESNVRKLHEEIYKVCEKLGCPYEIIFVDDGSVDNTYNSILNLYPLKYIGLRRNFGQTAAMEAGIHEAQNDYIITMDGDLQNDPKDIPVLIDYLETNQLDVVSGWRKNRKDTWTKNITSRVANFLRGVIVKDGIHDSGCSLKIYKRECFDSIHLYGEMHRFIPALLKIKGFKVGEIVVNHKPRTSGVTKYNWKRTFKGFVDMIGLWFWNKYASRPLHLFGTIGLLILFLGGVSGVVTIVQYFMRNFKVSDTGWPLLTVLFLITGVQFFVFGLLADIISKLYRESTLDKSYSIEKVIENKRE